MAVTPQITAALSVGPVDVLRPSCWVGGTMVASLQLLDDLRRPAEASEVTLVFRRPDGVELQVAGTPSEAVAAPARWLGACEIDQAGAWAVRAVSLVPYRAVDWILFDALAEPTEVPAPYAAMWLQQDGQVQTSTTGGLLSAARIDLLPVASGPDGLTLPAVRADGASVQVAFAVIAAGAQDAIAGDVQAVAAAVEAVDNDATAVEISRAQVALDALATAADRETTGQDRSATATDRATAEAARDTAILAAANVTTAVVDAAPQFATLAALNTFTPVLAEGRIAGVYADPGGVLVNGQYRRRGGAYVREADTLQSVAAVFQGTAAARQYLWKLQAAIGSLVLGGLRPDGQFDMPGWSIVPKAGGVYWKWRRHTLMALDAAGFRVRGFAVSLLGRARLDDTLEVARDPASPLEVATKQSSETFATAAAAAAAAGATAGALKRDGSDGGMTAPLSVPGARFGRSSLYIWNVRNLWGQVVAYLDGTRLRVPGGTWDHDGTLTPRGPVLLPTAPVSPLHAATKAYVDAAAGSAGGLASIERSQMSGRSGAGSNSNYAGGSLNFNVRLAMVASSEDDWSNVELLFGNFGQGLNADGPSDITLTLGIEYPAGQVMPVFWRAWQRSLTLIPGAVAGTVPMPASIPAGATWWLRIYGAVPTGGTWTQSWEVMQPAEGSGADFGTGVDKSLTGTIPTLFGWAPITPLAVLGKPAHGGAAAYGPRAGKRVKALAGLGDSIMEGLGDNVVSGGSGYRGWFPRGCTTAGMPWVRAARSGNRFIDFDTTTEQVRRCYSFVGCQAVVCNFATNDLNGGATLATLQSLAAALAATIKRMGLKYIPVTMTPRTNATNNGYYGSDDATKWQTRLDYNTWLRTNPFGDGIYDAAVVVEDPARPGYWLSAAPSDGLHPSEAQHTAIAADFASKIPTLLA